MVNVPANIHVFDGVDCGEGFLMKMTVVIQQAIQPFHAVWNCCWVMCDEDLLALLRFPEQEGNDGLKQIRVSKNTFPISRKIMIACNEDLSTRYAQNQLDRVFLITHEHVASKDHQLVSNFAQLLNQRLIHIPGVAVRSVGIGDDVFVPKVEV